MKNRYRHGWFFRAVFLLGWLVALATARGAEDQTNAPPVPTAVCRLVDRDLALTGQLDDPLWQLAKPVTLVDAVSGKPGHFKTVARLLASQRYLYVGFTCEDDYVWGTYTNRDDPIYQQEVVEVFVSPANLARQYYEIEVSPLNIVADTFVLNGRPPGVRGVVNFHTYFSHNLDGLITRTHVDGELGQPGRAQGWSAEMAIPYAALIGPENPVPVSDTQWRVNFFRLDCPRLGQTDFYAWSPTLAFDAHLPWRMGHLTFTEGPHRHPYRLPLRMWIAMGATLILIVLVALVVVAQRRRSRAFDTRDPGA